MTVAWTKQVVEVGSWIDQNRLEDKADIQLMKWIQEVGAGKNSQRPTKARSQLGSRTDAVVDHTAK